jgi:hypothetical protein
MKLPEILVRPGSFKAAKAEHCVFHIGRPKTGSSSIQAALKATRNELLEQGVFVWQGFPDNNENIYQIPRGQYALLGSFAKSPPPFLAARGVTDSDYKKGSGLHWMDFEASIRYHRPKTTVVSSETIQWGGVAPFLERLMGIFERVSVICYLRGPISHYPSLVGQRIKGGKSIPNFLPDTLRKQLRNAEAGLASTERILGRENLSCRLFRSDALVGSDAVQDFFNVLSAHAGRALQPPTSEFRVNESSPGVFLAYYLLRCDRLGGPATPEGIKILRHLQSFADKDPVLSASPRLRLEPGELLDTLISSTGSAWQRLSQRYLNDYRTLPGANSESSFRSDPKDQAQLVRDWLETYVTPEASERLRRAEARWGD